MADVLVTFEKVSEDGENLGSDNYSNVIRMIVFGVDDIDDGGGKYVMDIAEIDVTSRGVVNRLLGIVKACLGHQRSVNFDPKFDHVFGRAHTTAGRIKKIIDSM